MKQLFLTILALIFDKRLPHRHAENEFIVGTQPTVAVYSYLRAEREKKFEKAFEKYVEYSEMISGYHYTIYSLENLMELYEHYCDEAVNLLPDDFIEEVEKLKLQIQAK